MVNASLWCFSILFEHKPTNRRFADRLIEQKKVSYSIFFFKMCFLANANFSFRLAEAADTIRLYRVCNPDCKTTDAKTDLDLVKVRDLLIITTSNGLFGWVGT